MMTAKDFCYGISLKMLLRPVLCNIITAPVAILHALNPLRVFSSKSTTHIPLPHFNQVHVHVDLQILIEESKFAEDTGKVSNAASQVLFQVFKAMLEILLVFLSRLKKATACLPLVPAEEVLEDVLPPVPNRLGQGLESLLELSKGIGRLCERVSWFSKVFTLFSSLKQGLCESHNILVAPADHMIVEAIDIPPYFPFHITDTTAKGQETAQGDQEPHHPAAVFRHRVRSHQGRGAFIHSLVQ